MFPHSFFYYYLNPIFFILIVTCNGLDQNCPRKNACPTYLDYFTIDINPNCYCVPNVGQDVDKVATGLIGNSETHTVTTEDGYILAIFRMPQKNPKGVVVLNHPVTVCSRVWLFQGNESTALWFWQQGYDVWMTNNRGTLYAKRHKTLSPKNRKFWDFSMHEIGYYDHKAQFDYIYNITKTKLILIGHSMSTSTSFIYTALRPEEAKKMIKLNVAVGPVAYMQYIRTPTAKLSLILPLAQVVTRLTNWNTIIGLNSWYVKLGRFILLHFPLQSLVTLVISATNGWTPSNFQPNLINLLVLQGPSELSFKTLFHYAQIRNSKNKDFRMYDYGKKQNLKLYGQEIPPLYPLEKINVPTYLMSSYSDTLSTIKDADLLYNQFSDVAKRYGRYKCKGLSHVDPHVGKNRKALLFDEMFKLFDKLE